MERMNSKKKNEMKKKIIKANFIFSERIFFVLFHTCLLACLLEFTYFFFTVSSLFRSRRQYHFWFVCGSKFILDSSNEYATNEWNLLLNWDQRSARKLHNFLFPFSICHLHEIMLFNRSEKENLTVFSDLGYFTTTNMFCFGVFSFHSGVFVL